MLSSCLASCTQISFVQFVQFAQFALSCASITPTDRPLQSGRNSRRDAVPRLLTGHLCSPRRRFQCERDAHIARSSSEPAASLSARKPSGITSRNSRRQGVERPRERHHAPRPEAPRPNRDAAIVGDQKHATALVRRQAVRCASADRAHRSRPAPERTARWAVKSLVAPAPRSRRQRGCGRSRARRPPSHRCAAHYAVTLRAGTRATTRTRGRRQRQRSACEAASEPVLIASLEPSNGTVGRRLVIVSLRL